MARLFSVREIVDAALRKVGEYAPHDTGADPDSFGIGMDFFDLVAAEVMATEKPLWAVQEGVTITIPPATNPIDPVAIAGANVISPRSFMFLDDVAIINTNGDRTSLERMSRRKYQEGITDKTRSGTPEAVYVDRTEMSPKFYLYPRLPATGPVWQLAFTFYKYSANYTATSGHGFPAAWQLYLVHALAAEIGDGPVVTLESGRTNDWRRIAESKRSLLQARHEVEPIRNRRVRNNDMG